MKAFLNLLSSIWLFLWLKAIFALTDKDDVIQKLSQHISLSIKSDIENMVKQFPDVTIEEAHIAKIFLFEFYTANFIFLQKEKEIIFKKTMKLLNHKINWILSNK